MHAAFKRYLVLSIAVFAAMLHVHAQPKSIGTAYSFNGVALSYEHVLNDDCFLNIDVRAEMLAYFMDRNDTPGISASWSSNFIIKEWQSRNKNTVRFFAGPGAVIGFANDFRKEKGLFFGMKGRIGMECAFDRNISLSASLNPVLGTHMVVVGEHVEMKYYKNGLINTVIPEIGIKYTF